MVRSDSCFKSRLVLKMSYFHSEKGQSRSLVKRLCNQPEWLSLSGCWWEVARFWVYLFWCRGSRLADALHVEMIQREESRMATLGIKTSLRQCSNTLSVILLWCFLGMEANPELSGFTKLCHFFVASLLYYKSFTFAFHLSPRAINEDQSYDRDIRMTIHVKFL